MRAVRDMMEHFRAAANAAAAAAAAAAATAATAEGTTKGTRQNTDDEFIGEARWCEEEVTAIASVLSRRNAAAHAVADAVLERHRDNDDDDDVPLNWRGENHHDEESEDESEDDDEVTAQGETFFRRHGHSHGHGEDGCGCGARDAARCKVPRRLDSAATGAAEALVAGRERLDSCRAAVARASADVAAEITHRALREGGPVTSAAVRAWDELTRIEGYLDEALLASDLMPPFGEPGEARL